MHDAAQCKCIAAQGHLEVEAALGQQPRHEAHGQRQALAGRGHAASLGLRKVTGNRGGELGRGRGSQRRHLRVLQGRAGA